MPAITNVFQKVGDKSVPVPGGVQHEMRITALEEAQHNHDQAASQAIAQVDAKVAMVQEFATNAKNTANTALDMAHANTDKLAGIADGATANAAATAVPKAHGTAAVGTSAKYAREDHVHPSDNTDTQYDEATQTLSGLMSAADKKKLDGVAAGAQVNPAAATTAPKAHGTASVGTSAKYAREDHVHPAQTNVTGSSGSCTGNAATATKLATARTVDGVDFNGSAAITHYGTCSTAAATAAKAVALTGFRLATGSRICVRFTVANTANNPTLNVNNTGAKAIRYRDAAIERYYLEANHTYEFIYDGTYWQLVGDLNCPYELCEFYYFRHPTLRRGFEPLTGGVIQNAATKYPLAWAYLQTAEGKKLCKTEAEWQALSTKTYYTLADGTELGFNGIGGVPFFVVNTSAKTLRMPDIRGTFPEPAGFAPLNVAGDVALDAIREIYGYFDIFNLRSDPALARGALRCVGAEVYNTGLGGEQDREQTYPDGIDFASSRAIPTSNAIRPRSFGVLACAYLGQPAS